MTMVYYFDEQGAYTDRQGNDGKFFDAFGNNQGYVDSHGRYYDSNRAFKGTRKEDGMFYSPDGECLGYTDGKHWCFDAFGIFIESERKSARTEKDTPKEKKSLTESLKGILGKDR